MIPLVEDLYIRDFAKKLLPLTFNRPHTGKIHYIHRDLNPGNVLVTTKGACIIDWNMTHFNYREDDVAMTICCLCDNCEDNIETTIASKFLEGYYSIIREDWCELNHPILKAAIAIAGLRQAVSGWYTDQGDTSLSYWKNIYHRIKTACTLLTFR